MYHELALIAVVVAGGYWGWFFTRRRPNGTPLFGLMQLGAAGLAALGMIGRQVDAPVLGGLGAIGLGAGACLLLIAPALRGLARRAAAAERLALASGILAVAEVLAPGAGITEERAMIAALRDVRAGRVDDTILALSTARERAPVEARRPFDERIAMLYLAANRWDDAIRHAEAHLFDGKLPELTPELDQVVPIALQVPARMSTVIAVRRALGVAPPVWIELLAAYGRRGDLDTAARMMELLEDACAGRADAAAILHRGRMMFLALAGRVEAVTALVEPRHARHLTAAARAYWLAIALDRRGDVAAATAAYQRARARSRPGRPRDLIDQALAAVATAPRAVVSPGAARVLAKVEAAPPPVVPRPATPPRPWATRGLAGSLLVVAGVVALTIGSSLDVGVLTRAGAMVHGLVAAGEWWRLVACVFVHVGALHVAVNTLGLWAVGRLAEELYGAARTVAIFGVAGVAGAAASYLASDGGISAGASGAVLGLLGAVFAELTWHRHAYRTAWRRGVWGSLVVVTLAQLAVDFLYPVIDQWAHAGGLVVGAALGALLSRRAPWARIGGWLAGLLAVAVVAAAVIAAVLVVETDLGESLVRAPLATRAIGDVVVTAPAAWQLDDGELVDPDLFVVVAPHLEDATGGVPAHLAPYLAEEPTRARKRRFETVEVSAATPIPLPAGWQGSELEVGVDDPLGGRQRFRVVVVGRQVGDHVVLATVYAPEAIATGAPGFVTALIESIAPRS